MLLKITHSPHSSSNGAYRYTELGALYNLAIVISELRNGFSSLFSIFFWKTVMLGRQTFWYSQGKVALTSRGYGLSHWTKTCFRMRIKMTWKMSTSFIWNFDGRNDHLIFDIQIYRVGSKRLPLSRQKCTMKENDFLSK